MTPNVRPSSGLKWRWMDTYGLRYLLNYGTINCYGSDAPASPDLAPGAAPLATVTLGGLAFVPGVRAGGALVLHQPYIGILKPRPGDVWTLTGQANGAIRWFRWFANAPDANADDPYGDFVRLDGDLGGALLLDSPLIQAGQSRSIAGFILKL